ncbi:leucine-rich repeat-containing protein 45 isoform X12 [Callithrix jacchus]
MEEFRRCYSRLCRESGAEPQEAVLQQLHQLPRGRLDLATQSLTVDTCRALGKLLPRETLCTELVLSDCMLNEEGGQARQGATLLLRGLCANTVLRFLDLKGNNLRATGAEALGKLLQQNKSIQSLTLEWNNLGTWDDAFATFCGGLAANGTLQKLDLRNNQISHKGAEELALALKGNATLQQLEQAMGHNQDRLTTLKENHARTHVLSREVQHLREEKSKQFLDLMETIDKQREEMVKTSRASAAHIGQLQEALNERHSIINALKAKLQMTEAALALSEQKGQDLGELLATAEQEQLSLLQRQAKERRLEQQEAAERESKFLRDLSAANEKNLLLQNQVDELERKVKCQQEQLFQTRQELTSMSAQLKMQAIQAEERLDMEKRRSRQSLEDSESLRIKEELSRVKAAALSERGQAEEELIKAKSQARLEEQQRLAHLEDKLRLLVQARDEAQGACLQQKQAVVEAQTRASQLGLQLEGLRRRLEELQEDLSHKDQERVAEVSRVRVELQEQNGRLQAELAAQEALREKVAALERQLKVMASDHREALLDRESENASLREKLRLREAEIARIRDEEAQRASFLQNAVLAYVQGSPVRNLSPPK